jgi:hypothetical protein
MSDERERPAPLGLDAWLEVVTATLGDPDRTVSRDERALLLDLARVAAHRAERVAAPITAYLVGAVLSTASEDERISRLRRLVADLDVADPDA